MRVTRKMEYLPLPLPKSRRIEPRTIWFFGNPVATKGLSDSPLAVTYSWEACRSADGDGTLLALVFGSRLKTASSRS